MPDEKHLCGRRTKTCRNCKRKYKKEEYELWECPQCGEPRACTQEVEAEGKACHYHGGKSLKGAASPRFKHGRYSDYFPKGYADMFEASMSDPDMLSLLPNLALIDTYMKQVASSVDDINFGDSYKSIMKLYRKADRALLNQDLDSFAGLWQELAIELETGGSRYANWQELLAANEKRKGMVSAIETIKLKGESAISISDHLATIQMLTEVFLRHVKDEKTRKAVAKDLSRMQGELIQ